jgi:hypothetical protein
MANAVVSPYDPLRLARLQTVQKRSLRGSPVSSAPTTTIPSSPQPPRPLLSTTNVNPPPLPVSVSTTPTTTTTITTTPTVDPNTNNGVASTSDAVAGGAATAAAAAAVIGGGTTRGDRPGTGNAMSMAAAPSRLAPSASAPVLHASKDTPLAGGAASGVGYHRSRRSSASIDLEGAKAQRLKQALTTFLLTGKDPEEEARIAEEQAKTAATASLTDGNLLFIFTRFILI